MKNLPVSPKTAAGLFELPKIEQAHLQALSPEEVEEFKRIYSHKMDTLVAEERDAFINQIMAIIPPEELWEYNHEKIMDAIHQHVQQYGSMPPRSHLAEATGLSRNTIYRHLQDFDTSTISRDERDSFNIMINRVRSKVLQAALDGNLQAAKFILQGPKPDPQTAKKETVNNFVQINKTVINQQVIQQLNPEVLNQIEQLIAKELKDKQE